MPWVLNERRIRLSRWDAFWITLLVVGTLYFVFGVEVAFVPHVRLGCLMLGWIGGAVVVSRHAPRCTRRHLVWIMLGIWGGPAFAALFLVRTLLLGRYRWVSAATHNLGRGLCHQCGYDLRGTKGPLCPECGAVRCYPAGGPDA